MHLFAKPAIDRSHRQRNYVTMSELLESLR